MSTTSIRDLGWFGRDFSHASTMCPGAAADRTMPRLRVRRNW